MITLEQPLPDDRQRLLYLIGRLESNAWDLGYSCGNPDANDGDAEKYEERCESNRAEILKILAAAP